VVIENLNGIGNNVTVSPGNVIASGFNVVANSNHIKTSLSKDRP